jgi:deoxyribose-phosphate aldolase
MLEMWRNPMHTSSMEHMTPTITQLPLTLEPRNPGLPLDLDWALSVQANTSAIERRCASLPTRRSVKLH